MLDREIRDARPRIEIARPDESLCGAGIETAPAGAAAVRFERQVRLEVGVRQNDADERERADLGMDEHHVLADPAESRELCQLSLGHGTGIDVAARCRRGDQLPDCGRQLLEAFPEDLVVVRRPGVLSNFA